MANRGILMALILFGVLGAASACNSTSTPATLDPNQPALPEFGWVESPSVTVIDSGDVLGDGVIPPAMSAYRSNPSLALGALFAVTARNGTACSEALANGDDLEWIRLPTVSISEQCEPLEIVDSNPVYVERIVKGGADADIGFLVGNVALDESHVFELHKSIPHTSVYPADQICFSQEEIGKLSPPPRTCEIYGVVGAYLVEITLRDFVKAEVEAQYSTAIYIDTGFYGSTSRLQTFKILLVNPVTLSGSLGRDDRTGYLQKLTPSELASSISTDPDMTNGELVSMAGVAPDELVSWDASTQKSYLDEVAKSEVLNQEAFDNISIPGVFLEDIAIEQFSESTSE